MATDDITTPEFYHPWPKFGKKLHEQWGEIRENQISLNPIVKAIGLDPSFTGSRATGSVQAWESGETGFHNKVRTYWNKTNNQYLIQFNTGTEDCPTWDTKVTITEGGQLIADFYASAALTEVAEALPDGLSFSGVNRLFFSKDDGFYLKEDANGHPIVALSDRIKGGGSGGGGGSPLTVREQDGTPSVANVTQIRVTDSTLTDEGSGIVSIDTGGAGAGFYLNVGQTDDNPTFKDINTIKFNADNFYVTQNAPNTDEAIVNLRISPTIPFVTVTDTEGFTNNTDTIRFNRNGFYLTNDSQGKPIVNLGTTLPNPGDNIVSGTRVESFPSSVEWIFNHNLNVTPLLWDTFNTINESFIPDKVDVSDPNTAYFYFTNAIAGTAILSTGRSNGQVKFSTTNNSENQFTSDALIFNRKDFYLTSNSQSKPVLNLLSQLDEKSITVQFPTPEEEISFFVPSRDIKLKKLFVSLGATGFYPAVDWNIRYAPSRWESGTGIFNSPSKIDFYPSEKCFTSFDNDTIPAGNKIWYETRTLGS